MTATKIPWADRVWNPIIGCSPVSAGCANCYASRMATRLAGIKGSGYEDIAGSGVVAEKGKWTGKVFGKKLKLDDPCRWRKPSRIFVNSMGDLFHDKVTDEFIWIIFERMQWARRHTFLILTKRPERMRDWMMDRQHDMTIDPEKPKMVYAWPLRNVWLGVSVEDQTTADERIPLLLQTPAAVRFVSVEPMLGPVDLRRFLVCQAFGMHPNGLDWVIAGPETGPGARWCYPGWIEDILTQCEVAGVPFFDKRPVRPLEREFPR